MMMIKKTLLGSLGLAMLLALSCQPKSKGSFTVSGTWKNADKLAMEGGPVKKVYLVALSAGKNQDPIALDSMKVNGVSGSFSLSANTKTEEIFELVFGDGVLAVPFINDAEDIKVDVDLGRKDDFYTVRGSSASSQLKDLISVFGKKNFEVESAMADLDSLKRSNASDTAQLAATDVKNRAIQDLNTYLKQFINTNANANLCALALSWASRSFSKADFEGALSDLQRKFPDNGVLKSLKTAYDIEVARMAEKEKRDNNGSWTGRQAPELSLPDANGKMISLSSFKGKYVLVDFWASWCHPCREENPNVVKAYNQFRNKNFTILGVSLDKTKDSWLQAIQADQLTWTHVSDLNFWNSKAVETFGFQSIPFNVLIDPQGKVIAEGLRGDDLENKLQEVLK